MLQFIVTFPGLVLLHHRTSRVSLLPTTKLVYIIEAGLCFLYTKLFMFKIRPALCHFSEYRKYLAVVLLSCKR